MWAVWGRAARLRAAGLSLAIGVRGDGRRKEQPTDPGFSVNSAHLPVLDDCQTPFSNTLKGKTMEVRVESCVLVRLEESEPLCH